MNSSNKISLPVIKRLPRYYRYISEMRKSGISKVSSSELAKLMGSTASQVRQDFNCFGGFGQQGIGYSTDKLYEEIGTLLFHGRTLSAVLIGVGNLGEAICKYLTTAEAEGIQLIAAFDKREDLVGSYVGNVPIFDVRQLVPFCEQHKPQIAVICVPQDAAMQLAKDILKMGVEGIWNFSHYDFSLIGSSVFVENVHLSDSMMSLGFLINNKSL